MTETALDSFWNLVLGAIALNRKTFQLIHTLPQSSTAALLVVAAASLAQAVGESIILFTNRVKPTRFILSLLVDAVLFAASCGFWAFSTWFVSHNLFAASADLCTVARTLGFGLAPLMLSFLAALPYLGERIFGLLTLWSLLAIVVGLKVITGLNSWLAFTCAALGWAVFRLWRRTIGNPVVVLSKKLTNYVAGVTLVTDVKGLEAIVQKGPLPGD